LNSEVELKKTLYNAFVLLALVCLTVYVSTEKLRTTRFIASITDAQTVMDAVAKQAEEVKAAQEYSQPLTATIKLLSEENSSLIAREQEAAKVVGGFQQESKLLKASLKEAVEMIKAQQVDNNTLIQANEILQYKVDALEAALKAIKDAQDGVPTVVPVPDVPVPPAVVPTNPSKVAARYHLRSRTARFFSRTA
jgi:hypothetical protein